MDSEGVKKAIVQATLQETNTANARALIEGITGSCFEKCVPKPGTSLSSSEKTCMSYCVEKYIASWNEVNGTYIRRLRQGAEGNH
ncbi:uncharacterized protein PODANS_7_8930 [Podospora anserina S mat+]|uniref:Mitochondrial import inner membrane translocase subunit n=7 Tax=Sordariales TaxID=5139 RepID=B2AX08_PODAN|nr:uncharacterized protein PODANS_7_8930 [Podospora anserina S mat+]KAK0673831.1 Tim10/DDP family zinc finger-domain-containing protein [Cercophora samala]KAK4639509.1 protein translocase subunit [Podospora bellae-mahoneyi]KAK4650602.1 protein translocase subunit [Podospora pseudocomata]KAK4661920.1 protein translocase subunit [Podospora pseudopauciseta]KAK4668613.1 protein translocase subunit [Podospora pseudoanserina]VBB86877.1 Putative mitochondrial import inner membrane translocase subuni